MLWPKGREVNSRELFKESSRSGGKVGDGGRFPDWWNCRAEESWVNHMQGFSLMFENEEMGITEQLGWLCPCATQVSPLA